MQRKAIKEYKALRIKHPYMAKDEDKSKTLQEKLNILKRKLANVEFERGKLLFKISLMEKKLLIKK